MLLLVQYLRSGKQVQPTSSAGGLQPPDRRVGTSGSPGVPGSPSSPSLRGLRLSRPQAGGDSDPQPLRCPKSHPTRQPLATANSAVACRRVAPTRRLSLAGPGSLRLGEAQSREGQRREEGAQQGGDSLGAAREGEEERRKRRAGEELRQLQPPPPGPRAGPAPLEGAGGGLAPHPRFLSARPDAPMSLGQDLTPTDQAHAPVSNRSLLGLLPLGLAGQGEVGGPKTTPGEEDNRGVRAAADAGSPGRGCGRAGKRASRGGECLGGGARSAETD